MIGSGLVVTLSEGSFSCTMEGFERPFNALEPIAAHLRAMAPGASQDDLAEALRRIAEAQTDERVEAQARPGGLVLRRRNPVPAAGAAAVPPEASPSPDAPRSPDLDEIVAARRHYDRFGTTPGAGRTAEDAGAAPRRDRRAALGLAPAPDAEAEGAGAMARLWIEADAKLDCAATARRRSAIAHLRAALAANRPDVAEEEPARRRGGRLRLSLFSRAEAEEAFATALDGHQALGMGPRAEPGLRRAV